jgi:[ribosomal protein S5]-alanine N-acetyltransferase
MVDPVNFLLTDRLSLRDLAPTDWRDIMRLHTAEEVVRYLVDAAPRTSLEAGVFIQLVKKMKAERPEFGIWRVAKKANDEFLGNFSLMPMEGTDDVEIGGRLLKAAWGSGYSIEGGIALMKYAFEELKLPRIVSMSHPDNRAAIQSLIALGFQRAGTTFHYERTLPFFVMPFERWREHSALGLSWRESARINLRNDRRNT